jgi:hypothetical protein
VPVPATHSSTERVPWPVGGQGDLARLAALASAHPELAVNKVEVGEVDGDRLGAGEAAWAGRPDSWSLTAPIPEARAAVLTAHKDAHSWPSRCRDGRGLAGRHGHPYP